MLESMRNHAKGWVAKIILGGIALSFVLWGVGDYFTGGNAQPVATINDNPVGNAEFHTAYQRQLNAYRAMLGNQFSKELLESLNVKDTILQTIINRRIMLDVAGKLGLTAPESVVLSSVRDNPSFQSAGNFDPKRYQILTRNMGFGSAQDFENDLRLNIVVDALQKAVVGSVHVSDSEIRDRFNRQYEQRVLAAIVVDPATQLDKVVVSEAQAKGWYDSHKNNYSSQLRIKVNAVEINPADLTEDMAVEDAEVRTLYENRKADLTEPEQRKASHILAKVAAGASEAVALAARKKIEAAQSRLQSGEDFAKLAEQLSQDITADKGGDLGWFKAGSMAAAFDQAVFAMDKGDTSDIVETEFGFHLIRLDDIRPARTTAFEEIKDKLRDELVQARVTEEAYKLSQDLDDALGMEDSLKAAAEAMDMKLFSSDAVTMREAEVVPLLTDPKIRSKAFATLPGQAIEIIETDDGRFIAIEVVERLEPGVLPYENVARRVMADAKVDAANNRAREIADKICNSVNKSMDQLAQEYGQAKYISKPVRSNGVGDDATWLSKSLLDSAFIAASGAWLEKSVAVPQGYAAVRVNKTIASSEEEFVSQKANIAKEVEQAKGAVRFARWMASVRDTYEIEVNEQELARF